MADEVVGRVGRLTGTVGPGRIGEVLVEVRGGTERFHAYPADGTTTIAKGSRVIVTGSRSGRAVEVAPFSS